MDRLDAIVQELRNASEATPHEQAVMPARIRDRRGWRWWYLLPPLVLLVVAVVVHGRAAPDDSPVIPMVVQRSDPWRDVVASIDRRRMQAFMNNDPALLLLVEVRDSPAHRADLAVLTALRKDDIRPDRNALHVLSVQAKYETLSGDVKRARVRVTDVLGSYALVDAAGTLVATKAARGPRTWDLDLQRAPGSSWKLRRVTPAAASQPSVRASRPGT